MVVVLRPDATVTREELLTLFITQRNGAALGLGDARLQIGYMCERWCAG